MKTYIENIIKTGLANGLTVEQLLNNPEAVAKAYFNSQIQNINIQGENILNEKNR